MSTSNAGTAPVFVNINGETNLPLDTNLAEYTQNLADAVQNMMRNECNPRPSFQVDIIDENGKFEENNKVEELYLFTSDRKFVELLGYSCKLVTRSNNKSGVFEFFSKEEFEKAHNSIRGSYPVTKKLLKKCHNATIYYFYNPVKNTNKVQFSKSFLNAYPTTSRSSRDKDWMSTFIAEFIMNPGNDSVNKYIHRSSNKSVGFTLPIPKNSDKATDEIRSFVVRPPVKTEILAYLVKTIKNEVFKFKNEKSSLVCFGSHVTKENKISSYIDDFDKYEKFVDKQVNSGKYQFIQKLDIKKYFDNINHELLADFLSELFIDKFSIDFSRYYRFNDQSRYLFSRDSFKDNFKSLFLQSLKFEYTDLEGETQFKDKGLTIDSHVQHCLANFYMFSVLSKIMKIFDTDYLHKNDLQVQIVTYMDDIVILSNDKLDTKNIFTRCLEVFSLELNDQKSTDLIPITPEQNVVKSLVRLPGTSYIDYDFFNDDKRNINFNDLNSTIKSVLSLPESAIQAKVKERIRELIINTVYLSFDHIGFFLKEALFPFISFETIKEELAKRSKYSFHTITIESPDYRKNKDFIETQRSGYKAVRTKNLAVYLFENNPIFEVLLFDKFYKDILIDLIYEFNSSIFTSYYENNYFSRAVEFSFNSKKEIKQQIKKSSMKKYNPFEHRNQKFLFNEGKKFDFRNKSSAYISQTKQYIDNLNDENILKALQHLFLAFNIDLFEKEIFEISLELMNLIFKKYPSKIKFLSGIVKRYQKIIAIKNDYTDFKPDLFENSGIEFVQTKTYHIDYYNYRECISDYMYSRITGQDYKTIPEFLKLSDKSLNLEVYMNNKEHFKELYLKYCIRN